MNEPLKKFALLDQRDIANFANELFDESRAGDRLLVLSGGDSAPYDHFSFAGSIADANQTYHGYALDNLYCTQDALLGAIAFPGSYKTVISGNIVIPADAKNLHDPIPCTPRALTEAENAQVFDTLIANAFHREIEELYQARLDALAANHGTEQRHFLERAESFPNFQPFKRVGVYATPEAVGIGIFNDRESLKADTAAGVPRIQMPVYAVYSKSIADLVVEAKNETGPQAHNLLLKELVYTS